MSSSSKILFFQSTVVNAGFKIRLIPKHKFCESQVSWEFREFDWALLFCILPFRWSPKFPLPWSASARVAVGIWISIRAPFSDLVSFSHKNRGFVSVKIHWRSGLWKTWEKTERSISQKKKSFYFFCFCFFLGKANCPSDFVANGVQSVTN